MEESTKRKSRDHGQKPQSNIGYVAMQSQKYALRELKMMVSLVQTIGIQGDLNRKLILIPKQSQ
ncbi:hypothetical protein N9T01_00100 [bacterium]|nr:hypothetical protein [bacterium]